MRVPQSETTARLVCAFDRSRYTRTPSGPGYRPTQKNFDDHLKGTHGTKVKRNENPQWLRVVVPTKIEEVSMIAHRCSHVVPVPKAEGVGTHFSDEGQISFMKVSEIGGVVIPIWLFGWGKGGWCWRVAHATDENPRPGFICSENEKKRK